MPKPPGQLLVLLVWRWQLSTAAEPIQRQPYSKATSRNSRKPGQLSAMQRRGLAHSNVLLEDVFSRNETGTTHRITMSISVHAMTSKRRIRDTPNARCKNGTATSLMRYPLCFA